MFKLTFQCNDDDGENSTMKRKWSASWCRYILYFSTVSISSSFSITVVSSSFRFDSIISLSEERDELSVMKHNINVMVPCPSSLTLSGLCLVFLRNLKWCSCYQTHPWW